MPKGGHAASGPPPDPNALRRNRGADASGWTTLPAEGRGGEPPAWPLAGQTPREVEVWAELWGRPQAVAWEQLGQHFEVALTVRLLVESEEPGGSTERRKVLRQHLESLGLTVSGMLRNRWKIAPGAEVDDASVAGGESAAPRRRSARDRLKVVASDGGD